jgi:tRNA (Thr-GGU) A37 N-methylase
VAGVDVADGTPVSDLKPWVPDFDLPGARSIASFAEVRVGWYDASRLERPNRSRTESGPEHVDRPEPA